MTRAGNAKADCAVLRRAWCGGCQHGMRVPSASPRELPRSPRRALAVRSPRATCDAYLKDGREPSRISRFSSVLFPSPLRPGERPAAVWGRCNRQVSRESGRRAD